MPEKCVTLDNITYKDKWYKVNTEVLVDDKDVDNLEKIGAIRRLFKKLKTRSKIKTIINDIEVPKEQLTESDNLEEIPKIELEDEIEDMLKKSKRIKRKYGRR